MQFNMFIGRIPFINMKLIIKNNSLKKKESVGNKTRFVEIYETARGVDNISPAIKVTRLIIRYSTRIFGFYVATKFLGGLLALVKLARASNTRKYIEYILTINKLNIEYLLYLSNNNLSAAVLKKNKWAEFILKNSSSAKFRWSARNYLSLLSRHGFYSMSGDACNTVINSSVLNRKSKLKFYIYGPNASSAPDEKYKDYIIVFLKPIDIDVSQYKGSILFINGIYYRSVVSGNSSLRNKLIEKYLKIIVSCKTSTLDEPFQRAKFPMGENIASPMALGRLLYNLVMSHGVFSCVIEGFDFYLDRDMYASYYPSLARDKNNSINEQLICSGLASHDALFNYLYIKDIVGMLDLVDSTEFKKIIGMDGGEYLCELSKVRKFETLRKQ
jgi:hypothetical protein